MKQQQKKKKRKEKIKLILTGKAALESHKGNYFSRIYKNLREKEKGGLN